MRMLRLPLWIAGALFLLLVLAPQLVRFYVDWLWFGEIGYQPVYRTMLRGQATLFVVTFVAWPSSGSSLNLMLATRGARDIRPVFTMRNGVADLAAWRRTATPAGAGDRAARLAGRSRSSAAASGTCGSPGGTRSRSVSAIRSSATTSRSTSSRSRSTAW